ncbi:zinc ribbon domain-containing protein [Natrinema sp. H-ect1]|uniref:zinc ribbon domain-containing protein n=1 Tax=Natrinema sp. H-ect1 TaxID=3242700 RepID=UPI00359D6893
MSLVLLGAVLSLCLLPSLCFLGLWHGLGRLQRSSLIERVTDRTGNADTDPVVTWGDVLDAYSDPRKRLFAATPGSRPSVARDDQCAVCAAANDPIASYCHNCFRKLE